jgi:hypothetical protein
MRFGRSWTRSAAQQGADVESLAELLSSGALERTEHCANDRLTVEKLEQAVTRLLWR